MEEKMIINVIRKRYIIISLVAAAGLAGALPFLLNQSISKPTSTTSTLEQSIRASFQEEHAQLIEAIRQEFAVPLETWSNLMTNFKDCINADNLLFENSDTSYQKSGDAFIDRINAILASECINPDRVHIQYINSVESPLASVQEFKDDGSIQHTLQINKKWFESHSSEIQDAIIRHETVHLKHYDSIEGGYMIYLVTNNGYTHEDFENSKAVRAYRYHREMRADTLAGITDINIAKAFAQDFAHCVQTQHEDMHGHPSNAVRLENMTQLIAAMNGQKSSSSIA
jgi:hypothetical protein